MLVRRLHIRARAVTHGEHLPHASNRSSRGMQLNRRTEIRLTY